MRPILVPVLAAAALLALAGCQRQQDYVAPPQPELAMPEPPPAPDRRAEELTVARACASDIERFCAGVPPRRGMIKACMKDHVSELSAGCFDAVMGAIAAAQPE